MYDFILSPPYFTWKMNTNSMKRFPWRAMAGTTVLERTVIYYSFNFQNQVHDN